jgi:hypothetical protein
MDKSFASPGCDSPGEQGDELVSPLIAVKTVLKRVL